MCLLGLETRGCLRLLGFGESAADDTARGLNRCPSPILMDWIFISTAPTLDSTVAGNRDLHEVKFGCQLAIFQEK